MTSAIVGRWVVSFMPLPLYRRGKSPRYHWIGGWVDPRAGLDDVEKILAPTGTRTPTPWSFRLLLKSAEVLNYMNRRENKDNWFNCILTNISSRGIRICVVISVTLPDAMMRPRAIIPSWLDILTNMRGYQSRDRHIFRFPVLIKAVLRVSLSHTIMPLHPLFSH
jgi:hypothetical protein